MASTAVIRIVFLLHASKIRVLYLDQVLSPELAAELGTQLPLDCFPALKTINIRKIPVYQALPFLKRASNLTKVELQCADTADESLSRLPITLGTSSNISLSSLTVEVDTSDPVHFPSAGARLAVDACGRILHDHPSITHLDFSYQTADQLALIVRQATHLRHLKNCALRCHSTTPEGMQRLSAALGPSLQGLQVLLLDAYWVVNHGAATRPIIPFNGLIGPLLSLRELQELSILLYQTAVPISRGQISSMASAWPKMRNLRIVTRNVSTGEGSPTNLSSLLAFREFGHTLQELELAAKFEEDGTFPDGNAPSLPGLRTLSLRSPTLQPHEAIRVAEILDGVCNEGTTVLVNDESIDRTGQLGWPLVYRALQALRRAHGRPSVASH